MPEFSPGPVRSPIPRNSSSPIILSNGKRLKSSLKSSASSPHIPQITHIRAQSAPSTPNVLKNVHFAESDDGLESVRVYKLTGKPANISRPAGEETETETEAEPSAFPFPRSPGPSPLSAQCSLPVIDHDHPLHSQTLQILMPTSISRPCPFPGLDPLLSTALSLFGTLLSRSRSPSGLP
jgi:hypothetical protein